MSKKILLIEDEADQILLAQVRLKAHGFEVSCALDGEEAPRKVSDERPDVVLADCMVPKVNGLDVCRRLKQAPDTKGILVILITGHGLWDFEERSKTAGADAWFRRPYESAQLLSTIQTLLQRTEQEAPHG